MLEIIRQLGDAGKIKIQKLTYFLQESLGIGAGYLFRMYHYGPYSEDLDTDMTRLKLEGYVNITPDADGYGFHVMPADDSEDQQRGSPPHCSSRSPPARSSLRAESMPNISSRRSRPLSCFSACAASSGRAGATCFGWLSLRL